MDKKLVDSISKAWQEVYEKKTLDPVNKDALKGKHKDRADKDLDNDGDVDSSDKYLHKRRKAVSKAMQDEACGSDHSSKKIKKEDDQEMDNDEPMAKDGMKKCPECGGSTENHDEECSKYTSSEKSKASATKEAVRHEVHGYGEIITETDNGYDILFAHGVEFDVPAEQCESIRRAMDIAKKSSGAMTPAHKKINKMKKGLADNPRVKKALNKANEEDDVEEARNGGDDDPCWDTHKKVGTKMKDGKRVNDCVPKNEEVDEAQIRTRARVRNDQEKLKKARAAKSVKEGTVADLDQHVSETYSTLQQQTINAMRSMWEGAGAVANKKAKPDPKGQPADADDDNLKGKGAVDMAKDIDATGADTTKVPQGGDDEVGHDDASKAGRATKPAAKRPADQQTGDKSIIKGGK